MQTTKFCPLLCSCSCSDFSEANGIDKRVRLVIEAVKKAYEYLCAALKYSYQSLSHDLRQIQGVLLSNHSQWTDMLCLFAQCFFLSSCCLGVEQSSVPRAVYPVHLAVRRPSAGRTIPSPIASCHLYHLCLMPWPPLPCWQYSAFSAFA